MSAPNSAWDQFKQDFIRGQERGRQKVAERFENPQIPYGTYNWILFKCFDTCIKDFDNKLIDKAEADCVESCSNSLKESSDTFAKG